MSLSPKAQSTIEYMTIITLVIVGILIMSPYVIRSINSYFKTGDDAVEDSFLEEIDQAPPTGVTLPGCDCPQWNLADPRVTRGCGGGSPCARREEHWKRDCTPIGCQVDLIRFGINLPMFECRPNTAPFRPPPDDWCCEDWAVYMNCQGGPRDPDGPGPLLGKCCGVNAVDAPGGRCPDGQVERRRFCGEANFPQYGGCIADPDCIFQCVGFFDSDAAWCPNDTIDLPNSMITVHRTDLVNCTARKCEAFCRGCHIRNPGANNCILNLGSGIALQGACPPGRCVRGACGVTRCAAY